MAATVRNNPDRRRYEIEVDGEPAGFASYRLRPGQVVFTHTEITPGHEGQGLGGLLARGALDAVRAAGLKAVPVCPFIARYLAKHPEYADLAAEESHDATGSDASSLSTQRRDASTKPST